MSNESRSKAHDEKFCQSCGVVIKIAAEICPKCGVKQKSAITVPERNAVLYFILTIVTCGLFGIYWWIVTKDDINSLGASIPSGILFFLPFINIYWVYKYADGYVTHVKKETGAFGWFLFLLFLSPIALILIQGDLNKLAKS